VRLASLFGGSRNVMPAQQDEARKALADLVRFRKEHEQLYFSDLLWVTNFWERPRLNVDAFFED